MSRFPVPFREYLLMDANIVVKFLIISDIVLVGARGLLAPIFAIFAIGVIPEATIETIGIATTIYLVSKSIFQVPAAALMDKIKGERDDFLMLIIGSFISAILPLFYLVMRTPLELYIIQFFIGVSYAFMFPSYMAIFTRHIDRDKEGVEWGAYFTLVDLGAALAAAIGGVLAVSVGFNWVIIITSAATFLGTLLILPIKAHMRAAHHAVKDPLNLPSVGENLKQK
ncbi:MAG: MFS transporter [Candidatus Uhrbacteria bacterium]